MTKHTEVIHKKRCGFLTSLLSHLHFLTDPLWCLIAPVCKTPQIAGKIILKGLRTLTALLSREHLPGQGSTSNDQWTPRHQGCFHSRKTLLFPSGSTTIYTPFISQGRGVLHSCGTWWIRAKWETVMGRQKCSPQHKPCKAGLPHHTTKLYPHAFSWLLPVVLVWAVA